MKNYVFYGGERICCQWIYAKTTKEIVDKIKELNTFLRNFQKNSSLTEKTKKFIDDILLLEKTNFENVVTIFNKNMNFLKSFENCNINIDDKLRKADDLSDKANNLKMMESQSKFHFLKIYFKLLIFLSFFISSLEFKIGLVFFQKIIKR